MNNQENEIIIELKDQLNTVLKLNFSEDFFFGEGDSPLTKKSNEDKKFNIKINKDDLILMDEIAKANDIPRSQLINFILYEILKDQFNVFSNADAKLFLAQEADKRKNDHYNDNNWAIYAIEGYIERLMENILTHNNYHEGQEETNSDEFKIIKAKIKGLK